MSRLLKIQRNRNTKHNHKILYTPIHFKTDALFSIWHQFHVEFLQPMLPPKNFGHANSFVQVESNFRTKTEIEFSLFFFFFFSPRLLPYRFRSEQYRHFFRCSNRIHTRYPIVFLLSEPAVPRALPSPFVSLYFVTLFPVVEHQPVPREYTR